jgi:hypothetical protein
MTEKEYFEQLQKYDIEVNRLIGIIKKAIKYIETSKYEWGDLEEDNEDYDIDVYKLLEILESWNKNE